MFASQFEFLLSNAMECFESSHLYYIPRGEALARLRELSGENFGEDLVAWAEWGARNDMFLSELNRSRLLEKCRSGSSEEGEQRQ